MAEASLSRSRALSLRAPIVTEGERALFQRRVALMALVVFLLAGFFWVVNLVFFAFFARDQIGYLWKDPVSQVHVATTSLGLLVWLLTRSGSRSAGVLDALDIGSTLALCTGWTLMISLQPARIRPDLVGMLACALTLSVRAALLPSTPARSATVSAVSLAPLIVVVHLKMRDPSLATPLSPALYSATWSLLAIGASTTTSWVIYGLRLQVRKAMQLGQYMIEDKLGEGGMGVVYRASHAMLRRPTAVKLLSSPNEHAMERFEREVQITARLTHPNTVAIYDYGRTPDGVFYYAMEYLDGVSLEDLVEATGPQPPARVVHLLLQVCGALREAHEEGLVHRDIKPANIMLTARGKIRDFVKVLDFGLVKETITGANAAVTQTNAILGTPHYMAPESILEPNTIDGRADIYALGATAFFLLTAQRVFDGSNLVEVCAKQLHDAPVAPSTLRADVPASLDEVILACLEKKAERRPADAAQLAEMLRRSGVAEWTAADAHAWWESHGNAARAGRNLSTTSVLGETIGVAIDDRMPARA